MRICFSNLEKMDISTFYEIFKLENYLDIISLDCSYMNLNQLPNWQSENPECTNMDTRQNEELIQYSLSALGGQYKEEEDKFMDKIMKNVLKEVVVNKN